MNRIILHGYTMSLPKDVGQLMETELLVGKAQRLPEQHRALATALDHPSQLNGEALLLKTPHT